MAEQVPSVGRVVHFVHGDQHVPALIIDPAFTIAHPEAVGGGESVTQALAVFTISDGHFTTTADLDPDGAPGTWHWPEFVPSKG